MKITITQKILRTLLVGIAIAGVSLSGYAVYKLLTTPTQLTDTNGCLWDEISPRKVNEYQDGTKAHTVKSENDKYYLLRECKE